MKLTAQEERVLELFRRTGGQNKELAAEMNLSKKTIDFYMHQIRRKLKIDNRSKFLIKEGDLYV